MEYTQWDEWTLREQNLFKKWLTGVLKTDTVEITFTKVDGSERVINASLKEDVIPASENKTGRTRAVNSDVISVVDVDLGEWRSIRYETINGIKVTLDKSDNQP